MLSFAVGRHLVCLPEAVQAEGIGVNQDRLPLGVVTGPGAGAASGARDRLLTALAARLGAAGWRLAGAVQINRESAPGRPHDMDLLVLTGAARVRISQRLGAQSQACRLDAGALERAAGLAEAAFDAAPGALPDLVIVNKFGKQEGEGRGFVPLIGRALAAGVPVLSAVGAANRAAFDAFAGGLAEELPADAEAVAAWCARVCGRALPARNAPDARPDARPDAAPGDRPETGTPRRAAGAAG